MARCANVAIGLPVRGDVLLLPMFGSRLAQALATARRGGHFDRLFFLVMMFDNFERFWACLIAYPRDNQHGHGKSPMHGV